MAVTIDELQIEIQQRAENSSSGIDALASSLSKLKMSAKGGAGLTTIYNQINKFNQAIMSINAPSEKINSLVSSLMPLNEIGKSNLGSALNQLKKIPDITNGLDVSILDAFATKIKRVTEIIQPLANEMQKVSNGFSKLPINIQKAINANAKLTASNGRLGSSFKSISFAAFLTNIKYAYSILKQAVNVVSGWISESTAYVENLNLFTVAMGSSAEEAQNFAQKVSDLMGIDISDWMRNQAIFQTLATGFGVASDKATIMSQNLTQLGYDLSSFFNIPIEDSMQKLQSGLSGELEPLRRLGYDLSQAKLQAIALSLGIDKSVSSMTQAEKSQLRYYAIMTQVTTAQGDMSRTLETPANQLRIFDAMLRQVSRALGNIFIPALNAVLPYAIAFLKVIKTVAQEIANLFGFKLPDIDYSSLQNVSTSADDATSSLDDATASAKELKGMLAGFDEINVIQQSSSGGGGSGAGASTGDSLGFELPQYDFLAGLTESKTGEIFDKIMAKIRPGLDFIKENMNTILVLATAIGAAFLAWKIGSGITTAISTMGSNLLVVLGLVLAIAGAVLLVSGGLDAWNNGVDWDNLTMMLAGTALLVTGLAIAFGTIGAVIGAAIGGIVLLVVGIKDWLENGKSLQALSAIAIGLLAIGAVIFIIVGGWIPLVVAAVAAAVVAIVMYWDEIVKFFQDVWSNISSFFEGLGDWFDKNVIQPIVNFFKPAIDFIATIFEGLWIIIQAVWKVASTWFNTNVIQPIVQFFSPIISTIAGFFSSAWEKIKSVWNIAYSWFDKNVIQPISSAFSTAWDNIKSTFEKAFNGIKSFAVTIFNGIIGGVESAINGIIGGMNGLITSFNNVVSWAANVIGKDWKGLSKITTVSLTRIKVYEQGGFPETGNLFIANEAGPELVGQIGNRTAVANGDQIISGVSYGVSQANAEQNALLREQNNLLKKIAQKDGNVVFPTSVEAGRALDKSLRLYNSARGNA